MVVTAGAGVLLARRVGAPETSAGSASAAARGGWEWWVALALVVPLHVAVLWGTEAWRAYVVTRFIMPPAALLALARSTALASGAVVAFVATGASGRVRAAGARSDRARGIAIAAACALGLTPAALALIRTVTAREGWSLARARPAESGSVRGAVDALLGGAAWVGEGVGGGAPEFVDLAWPPVETLVLARGGPTASPERWLRRCESALLRGGRLLIELPNEPLVGAVFRIRARREGVAAQGCWLVSFGAADGGRRFLALGRDVPAWAESRRLAHSEPPRVELVASPDDLR